eukprot:gene11631-17935_t
MSFLPDESWLRGTKRRSMSAPERCGKKHWSHTETYDPLRPDSTDGFGSRAYPRGSPKPTVPSSPWSSNSAAPSPAPHHVSFARSRSLRPCDSIRMDFTVDKSKQWNTHKVKRMSSTAPDWGGKTPTVNLTYTEAGDPDPALPISRQVSLTRNYRTSDDALRREFDRFAPREGLDQQLIQRGLTGAGAKDTAWITHWETPAKSRVSPHTARPLPWLDAGRATYDTEPVGRRLAGLDPISARNVVLGVGIPVMKESNRKHSKSRSPSRGHAEPVKVSRRRSQSLGFANFEGGPKAPRVLSPGRSSNFASVARSAGLRGNEKNHGTWLWLARGMTPERRRRASSVFSSPRRTRENVTDIFNPKQTASPRGRVYIRADNKKTAGGAPYDTYSPSKTLVQPQ